MKAYQAKDRINRPHLLIHACQSKGKQSQYTLLPKSIVGKLLNTKKKRSFDDILEESFNGIIKKNNSEGQITAVSTTLSTLKKENEKRSI